MGSGSLGLVGAARDRTPLSGREPTPLRKPGPPRGVPETCGTHSAAALGPPAVQASRETRWSPPLLVSGGKLLGPTTVSSTLGKIRMSCAETDAQFPRTQS